MPGTRKASHADSWYTGDPEDLANELDKYLSRVPETLEGSSVPVPGARVIIAPHAGYSYSGPCAAWAYKALDLSKAKRVFVLGPSHTYYLGGCALTTFDKYATPFGDLVVDQPTVDALRSTGKFENMRPRNEVQEHSLEMHLPYLWKRLEQSFGGAATSFPPIVPVLVGSANEREEKTYGGILEPYLADSENAFIVSSDFCHWGDRFSYQPHCTEREMLRVVESGGALPEAGRRKPVKGGVAADWEEDPVPAIHESIEMLDRLAMDAIKTGDHSNFVSKVSRTQNTVCGRHPIGVVMAAMEILEKKNGPYGEGRGMFKFVQYQRSNLVDDRRDSSVSYAAAFAIL